MNEAMRWVEEHSQAKGAAWTLLWALAKRANGCVARCTADQAIREGRLSRSELYRMLRTLENIREIERLSEPRDPKPVRAFHFGKIHVSQGFSVLCSVSPTKQATVPDLRDSLKDEDKENCFLCQGTGWKVVPRPEGIGKVAVRCLRHLVQLNLLEIPTQSCALTITPVVPESSFDRSKRQVKGPLFEGTA